VANRATFKFKTGPLSGKSYSLGPGEYFFIGSAESCAIRIVDDPLVEASHAAVFYDPSGRILFKDLGTKSGTYVNGKRIKSPIVLNAGDRVTIGKFHTFHSSWWNALQATVLTKFSNVRLYSGPAETKSRKYAAIAILAGSVALLSAMGVNYYLKKTDQQDFSFVFDGDEQDDRGEGRSVKSQKNRDLGIFSGTLSSKLFREKAKKPARRRIELTPERQFIWDEIVAIPRRFGDPPPSALDPGFVQEVEKHIARFTKNNYHQVLLKKKAEYSTMIEKTLIAKGLPPELGYIVWVESNYKVDARSQVGALGLWQFMPETGAEDGFGGGSL